MRGTSSPSPAGNGKRYRITVEGPGVTPDLQWEGAGLHDFNPNNLGDVEYEKRMDSLFMQFLGNDKFCSTQRSAPSSNARLLLARDPEAGQHHWKGH